MKRPLDSLFGRLVLTAVVLIVLVQATMLLLVEGGRASLETRHLSRAIAAAMLVHDRNPALVPELSKTMGIAFISSDQLAASGCPAPCTDTDSPLETHLRPLLPPSTHVVMDDTRTLWIHTDGHPYALVVPNAIPPINRFLEATVIMLALAIVAAIVATWQIHRPVRELAAAARAYRFGEGWRQIRMRGPRELRDLIGDFNDMVSELAEADRERSEMLASIAHDLRAPLTRIQVRADLLDSQRDRGAFLRDTASMGRIIAQFLSFAGAPAGVSDLIGVDAHCRHNYTEVLDDQDSDAAPLVTLDLKAGPGFILPSVDLDRILSNLIENAMTYGEPPVDITTTMQHGQYKLIVRDHGLGVPEAHMERVMRPFVRLDAARGGFAHCGLGLAIVKRLARHHGGTLTVSNARDGGFVATLCFPAQGRAATDKIR